MPKHFVNDANAVVNDAINGLLVHAPNLACLAGVDNANRIVVRRDWIEESLGDAQVALISGGGSGHEPAHGGLVGEYVTFVYIHTRREIHLPKEH